MVVGFQHSISLEWVFWLDFQHSGVYLLILYCLVPSSVLKTGAMAFIDVKKGLLECHRVNKIWWGISYSNGYLLWAYGISHNLEENLPWGNGFVVSRDNQLIWFSNPNTCTGFPYNCRSGLNCECSDFKHGLSLRKSFFFPCT